MGIQGKDHVGVIEKGKARRKARRKRAADKQKPNAQFYGGSKDRSRDLSRRNDRSIDYGEGEAYEGSKDAQRERRNFQQATNAGYDDIYGERIDYGQKTKETLGQNETERLKQLDNEQAYGLGADQSLANYNAGRGAVLGGATAMEQAGGRSAGMLEGYAQNAATEYQSAADLAAKAAAERNQRAALGIAAGRGPGAVRQALAGATAANAQGALDQQVVRAQEANQLNAMRNQAIADAAAIRAQGLGGAAQIRQGLGAQDQAAASLQAGRQQAYGDAAMRSLGQRFAGENANANYQLQGAEQMQALEQANANMGLQTAGLRADVGQNAMGNFLGAEGNQYSSQLGSDAASEAQRQQWEKDHSSFAKFNRGLGVATLGILGGSK